MNSRVTEAADYILRARSTGTLAEPWSDAQKPQSLHEAYDIQDSVAERCGLSPVGWKLGCTSEKAQQNLGSDGPIAGRMFAEHILPSGASIGDARPDMLICEAEFVVRMGSTLQPRKTAYSGEEVLEAIGSLYPGIELVQSWFRVSRMPINEMIADNSGFGRLIAGAEIPQWRKVDRPAAAVSIAVDGEIKGRGHGADVLGDPLNAVVWLANFLSSRNLPLRAGDFITTGTCTGIVFARPGSSVVADFGVLGRVETRFQA